MGFKWSKGSKPGVILARLASCCRLTDEKTLQFEGFEFFELEPLLHEIIEYERNYSFDVVRRFRDHAIRECLKKGAINVDNFKRELNKQISIYECSKDTGYALVSSISVVGSFPSKYRLPDVEIRIYRNLPKKYLSREIHYKRWEEANDGLRALPDDESVVVARVHAKHESDAVLTAIDGVDFVRGIMGLSLNPGMSMTLGGGIKKRKPLNKVLLGGVHSLHYSSGDNVGGEFWYEADYKKYPSLIVSDESSKKLGRESKFFIGGILSAPAADSKLLYSSVIRYARALDEVDRDVVIIKLWSALETLVAKGESNADSIVRRCSSIYRQHEYLEQYLECIRQYRNKSVHKGVSKEGAEIYCYQLSRIFKTVLSFYIGSLNFCESIDEVNSFLDMPKDIGSLDAEMSAARRRLMILKKAKIYRQQ